MHNLSSLYQKVKRNLMAIWPKMAVYWEENIDFGARDPHSQGIHTVMGNQGV